MLKLGGFTCSDFMLGSVANTISYFIQSEAYMLSDIFQERNARSRGHWFTEFCNSQRLSHFAAPFIGARAKISVAENCAFLSLNSQSVQRILS